MQVLSRWGFSDIMDLDAMFERLLHELAIFGEELRQAVDDVHPFLYGSENRLSLFRVKE